MTLHIQGIGDNIPLCRATGAVSIRWEARDRPLEPDEEICEDCKKAVAETEARWYKSLGLPPRRRCKKCGIRSMTGSGWCADCGEALS